MTGQRKAIKVFGSVDVFSGKFLYQMAEVFHAQSYLAYLERMARAYFPRPIFLVQDNASEPNFGQPFFIGRQRRRYRLRALDGGYR